MGSDCWRGGTGTINCQGKSACYRQSYISSDFINRKGAIVDFYLVNNSEPVVPCVQEISAYYHRLIIGEYCTGSGSGALKHPINIDLYITTVIGTGNMHPLVIQDVGSAGNPGVPVAKSQGKRGFSAAFPAIALLSNSIWDPVSGIVMAEVSLIPAGVGAAVGALSINVLLWLMDRLNPPVIEDEVDIPNKTGEENVDDQSTQRDEQ